jgi:acylphosphatase
MFVNEVVCFVTEKVFACTHHGALRHWLHMVVHFLVRGRVQGVGFRWFVHREAAELGLRGSVRNTDDGAVEVVAAGTPEALTELRAELHKGSRGSRVDAVVEHELVETEADALGPFQIEGAW